MNFSTELVETFAGLPSGVRKQIAGLLEKTKSAEEAAEVFLNELRKHARQGEKFDAATQIARFKTLARIPDDVAIARVLDDKGRAFFGIDTKPQTAVKSATGVDTLKPRRKMWERLVAEMPAEFRKKFPNSRFWSQTRFLQHAEAHALIRANAKGKLSEYVVMHVDRPTCQICRDGLPLMLKALGVEQLTAFWEGGSIVIKAID